MKKKFNVKIYFTPYARLCGAILNDYPEQLDEMQTWAVSPAQAEKNVRWRFLRNRGTNGHPLSQFHFVAQEATA